MPTSLADAAGRARPLALAGEQLLPVLAPLAPLFPDGGLRRGSTVAIGGTGGTTSLTLAVTTAASRAGSWSAAVGLPALGLVAAAGYGLALERFALVAEPGEQWPAVMAALVDAVDLILVRPPVRTRATEARRLMARARERGVVLVVSGPGWPEAADIVLTAAPAGWRGLGYGHGYLQGRSVEVTSTGRRAAARPRRVTLWLPGRDGVLAAPTPAAPAALSAVG
ncbi:MAG TPA: hypothetical protein VHT75_06080 [Acidimicrobiales bacterium]|nr:hypothetical protein [Acidimicrobiales bacterium]